MAETIESFVEKLQTEGVQAGQKEAEKIRSQAQQQARQIIDEAKKQAESIVDEARSEAEKVKQRSQTDLELACRDALLRLRDALSAALEAVVKQAAEEKMTDADFLAKTLGEIVTTYAQSDMRREGSISINLQPEMRDRLVKWALDELGREVVEGARESIDLKGTLKEAGFEYSVTGPKVEFTVSSIVEVLKGMIEPALYELISQAASQLEQPQGEEARTDESGGQGETEEHGN